MDQATIEAIAADIEGLIKALEQRGLAPARVNALLPALAGQVLVFETSAAQVSARQSARQPRSAALHQEDWHDQAGLGYAARDRADLDPAVLL
jgi:hypothetical protein